MAELSRALWKGEISFGMYSIPVKLFSAVRDIKVHFNLLDSGDNAKLIQQMWCPEDEEPVEKEHIIKGYEVTPGNYIEVSKEELESIEPQASRNIEIRKFVKLDELDLRYLEKYYYLASDGSEDSYAALAQALKSQKIGGYCIWTMRKKKYSGIIKYYNKILALITLRAADEVRPAEEIKPADTKLNPKELEIAVQLIDALDSEFKPENYDNEYQQKLRALIEQKAAGKRIRKKKIPKIESTKSTDLVKTLEKSLEIMKKQRQKG